MATTISTAYRDQITAATTHATAQLRAAAHAWGATTGIAYPDPWLADQIHRFLADLTAGRTRFCLHIDTNPRVLQAALWAPRLLVCQACAWLLRANPTEDNTCDRCRRRVPTIHAHLTQIGIILLGYGLCPACANPATRKDPQ